MTFFSEIYTVFSVFLYPVPLILMDFGVTLNKRKLQLNTNTTYPEGYSPIQFGHHIEKSWHSTFKASFQAIKTNIS